MLRTASPTRSPSSISLPRQCSIGVLSIALLSGDEAEHLRAIPQPLALRELIVGGLRELGIR